MTDGFLLLLLWVTFSDKLLHATSNGRLSLHSTAASDPSPSQTLRLPANLTSLLPSASATHFAYAGKEVDVSLWDIEAGFAGKGAEALEVEGGKKRKLGGGKKADKEKLMEGEVWRARNVRVLLFVFPFLLCDFFVFLVVRFFWPERIFQVLNAILTRFVHSIFAVAQRLPQLAARSSPHVHDFPSFHPWFFDAYLDPPNSSHCDWHIVRPRPNVRRACSASTR